LFEHLIELNDEILHNSYCLIYSSINSENQLLFCSNRKNEVKHSSACPSHPVFGGCIESSIWLFGKSHRYVGNCVR